MEEIVKKLYENRKNLTFRIPRGYYRETELGLGLRIERCDGVILSDLIYFPKSQISNLFKLSDGTLIVDIPSWLLDKKLFHGFRIVQG